MINIFFFNDTATTEIYTLSLHDALPICCRTGFWATAMHLPLFPERAKGFKYPKKEWILKPLARSGNNRSEEHTSELQSQSNLVCRLLLEKKKHTINKECSC